MKRKICFFIFLLFIIGTNVFAHDPDYKSNEIFVRFAQVNGQIMTYTQRTLVLSTYLPGSSIEKSYNLLPGLTKIRLPDGIDVPSSIGKLNKTNLITYAEPIYYRQLMINPNDTDFGRQWSLPIIKAPAAWDILNNWGRSQGASKF